MTNKTALKKERGTPKDVFAHLLSTVTLAMSVVAFTTIWWQIINIQLPDPVSYYYTNSIDLIRSSVAVLIVGWPIYLFLARLISKDISSNPDKQNIHVRKWLMYLTLFVASIALIIDLVTLINSFLGGELTGRFALKLLAVFISAIAVFGYYLWDVRRDVSQATKTPLIAALVSCSVVIIALVAGFAQIGSPIHQRDLRLDTQRVNDLSTLQYNALNMYQTSKVLPESLNAMEAAGWSIPTDPQTMQNYEYRVLNATSFELCATFSADSVNDNSTTNYREYGFVTATDWAHQEGRTCFTREVDPTILTPKVQ